MTPKQFHNPSRVSTFKIYLSNLPDGLKNAEIKAMFEEYGRTVECEVFKKNYAFVHMEEEDCGRQAVSALNKKELNGKTISVSVSKNMEPPNVATTKLLVKNLPFGMQPVRLRKLFQKFGLVLEAEVTISGQGIISLEATGDIRTAINEMNGFDMDGKKLRVEPVKVNLKAERYGHPPPQGGPSDWTPKYMPAQQQQRASGYSSQSRQGPTGRYSLGGGYGPSAQVEEFYGQDQEYYGEEEEEYYEPEYEPPVSRRYSMASQPMHQQTSRLNSSMQSGVDFVRREDMFYEDAPLYPPPQSAPQLVPRNSPGNRSLQGFGQGYENDSYDTRFYTPSPRGGGGRGGGRGVGRGGGRGGGGPSPLLMQKRKVVRGEPYPSPPVPHPRALLGGFRGGFRGGMRPMRAPMTGMGHGGMRPKTRGGAPSLLAAARHAASIRVSSPYAPDPFAPSAAEERLQQQERGAAQHPGIDFTADIMLS